MFAINSLLRVCTKGGEDNFFPPASKPTLSAPVSAPSELVFAPFQVPAVGDLFEDIRITRPPQCDGCGYALAAGGLAYGCRAANCDLCGACYEATKSKRTASQAAAQLRDARPRSTDTGLY
jgi:hypothetical protein